MPQPKTRSKCHILIAGAASGFVVDIALFPIDTIKSRLQSKDGFAKSGGLSRLYNGIRPVLTVSIPNSALFFITYETIKNQLHHYKLFSHGGNAQALNHMLAASSAEIVSCMIRVPSEVIKTRLQTSQIKRFSSITLVRQVLANEGLLGLYRGSFSTIMRDVPFSALQYPIWERFKQIHQKRYGKSATVLQSALYASIAGAFAAFLTTPMDVAKTRIMLAEKNDSLASGNILKALAEIRKKNGFCGMFAGALPRVIWISLGAAVFLGTYEAVLSQL